MIECLDEAIVIELITGADLNYLGLEDEDDLFKEEIRRYFDTTLSGASEIQRNVIIAWRVLVNGAVEKISEVRGNVFD